MREFSHLARLAFQSVAMLSFCRHRTPAMLLERFYHAASICITAAIFTFESSTKNLPKMKQVQAKMLLLIIADQVSKCRERKELAQMTSSVRKTASGQSTLVVA